MTHPHHAEQATSPPDYRVLCHDLVQFVSAAMLMATAPTDARLDPELQQRLEFIERQLSQMHLMLQAALQAPDEDETADVVAMVRECVDSAAARHRIDLIVDLPRAHLRGDHTALRRAVTNVLDNAVRAAQEDDRVVVRVSGTDGMVNIEVRDTGVGFGRLDSHHGLGMVSVADALKVFHGSLEISSGPGPGTLVRLVLPRSRP